MRCRKCEMIVPDKDRFCDFCGTDLRPERTLQADNPYYEYKRQQFTKRREVQRQEETKALDERGKTKKVEATRRRMTKKLPRQAEMAARRAKTKPLPSGRVGAAVAGATRGRGLRALPDFARVAIGALCGLVVVSIVILYGWKYSVGYASPHQLVLDFDRAVREGLYGKANALASGTLPGELMEPISRASLSETYYRHVLRVDESTRRIEYDAFMIDLCRSLGKWKLIVAKKSGGAAGT